RAPGHRDESQLAEELRCHPRTGEESEDTPRSLHAAPLTDQRARYEDGGCRPQRAGGAPAGGPQVHREEPQVARFARLFFQSFRISARPSMKTVARWRSSGRRMLLIRSMARSKSR